MTHKSPMLTQAAIGAVDDLLAFTEAPASSLAIAFLNAQDRAALTQSITEGLLAAGYSGNATHIVVREVLDALLGGVA